MANDERTGDLPDVDLRAGGVRMHIGPLDSPGFTPAEVRSVPDDRAEAYVDAALSAGGRIRSGEHAPQWWTITDPEGNEVDIAVTAGRDQKWAAANP